MLIYINARFLTRSVTGVERYATEFIKAIDYLIDCGKIEPSQFSFVMLAPQNIIREFETKHIPLRKVGYFSGHLWEQLELPFYARNGFLISLCTVSTLFKHNQVVTIHDAAYFANPKAFSFALSAWSRILLLVLGRVVKKVITVSFFSKKELQYYCGFPNDKIQVIYEGKEHILHTNSNIDIIRKHDLKRRPFVLAVSSLSPNKNFTSIVKAIELMGNVDFDVVIAGGSRPNIFRQASFDLSEKVKYVGYVSDEELKALYEHAACFVFPSFYEGFGLPPLEAMACGCPVIASESSALPEVFDDAALYCNPHSPEDIANKIQQLMGDAQLRKKLQEKGIKRAKQFSWNQCAAEVMSVIEEVIFRKKP